MPKIRKTTFTVTVLHSADLPVDKMSADEILAEMDNGECIGSIGRKVTMALGPNAVKNELLAIGNDGTFFDVGY